MLITRNTTIKGFGIVAAALTVTFAAAGAASAGTEPTEPADAAGHTMAHAEGSTSPPVQDVDGSAEATSPEVEAFCTAAIAAEAAASTEDPAVIGPAFEAVVAAAPADIVASVEAVIANAETEGPEFAEAYNAMVEYMKVNCGYAELNVAASEYAFGGLPPEVVAGPTIVTLENIGEEVHEIAILRVNDEVTLTLDELLALPEEESETMTTFAGFSFVFPGETSYALVDLTPGRYVALCFLPEGATPEIISQMEGPEDSPPPGAELGGPHFTLGMVHEFQVI